MISGCYAPCPTASKWYQFSMFVHLLVPILHVCTLLLAPILHVCTLLLVPILHVCTLLLVPILHVCTLLLVPILHVCTLLLVPILLVPILHVCTLLHAFRLELTLSPTATVRTSRPYWNYVTQIRQEIELVMNKSTRELP